MTTDYSPSKLFFEEAKKNARGTSETPGIIYELIKQFCHIIRTLARRIYSTMPMEDAEQLMIDEVLHNCLPMYTNGEKFMA